MVGSGDDRGDDDEVAVHRPGDGSVGPLGVRGDLVDDPPQQVERRSLGRARPADLPVREVEHGGGASTDVHHEVDDLGDGGPGHDQPGETFVEVDDAGEAGGLGVGGVEGVAGVVEFTATTGSAFGGGEGDRDLVGEQGEEGDLVLGEVAFGAVGGEQYPGEPAERAHRDAEDGGEALLDDDRVDDVGVLLVGEVVAGPAGCHRLGDLPAEAETHAEADGVEAGAGRALGHAHVGVATLGVEQHDVRQVGAHDLAGGVPCSTAATSTRSASKASTPGLHSCPSISFHTGRQYSMASAESSLVCTTPTVHLPPALSLKFRATRVPSASGTRQ
ncbi:hypothetical protein QYF62_16220 [Dietzia kunjamensis]|uniref:Uncharacterized protein n=1 Tax=Dietzia maris TaxID=37915 RepID=A0ABT8H5U3_9ACTN|nr:hypothetical protein [Dietzia maris]MDN4507587.1 hypothetical protein [Dietzia maris]